MPESLRRTSSDRNRREVPIADGLKVCSTPAHVRGLGANAQGWSSRCGRPQTAEEYAANLEQNLLNLIDRIKSGRYQAPPVRRHYIAKSDGGQRGLGIPCFEDKVAQRAVSMLLEPIYERDFMDCSYGFRPRRNAHQAVQAVAGKLHTVFGGRGRRSPFPTPIHRF